MNVSKAEIEITEALNDGALLDDILDGARRYANWVKHKGWCGDHKYISLPNNWIKNKRWLDDFEVSAKDKIKVEFEVDAEAKVKPTKKTAAKDAPRSAKSKAKVTPAKAKPEAARKPKYKQGFAPHVIKPINQLTPKEVEEGWGLPEYADFWGVHNKCRVNEYRGCSCGAVGLCNPCKEKYDKWKTAKDRMNQPPVTNSIKRLTPKEIEQQKMELERDIQLSHDKQREHRESCKECKGFFGCATNSDFVKKRQPLIDKLTLFTNAN